MKKDSYKNGFISSNLLFIFFVFFIVACIFIIYHPSTLIKLLHDISQVKKSTSTNVIPTPITSLQNPLISQTPIKKNRQLVSLAKREPAEEWGKAQKIGEHTYTIKLGQDDRMGTPQEIYEALNTYRSAHNRGTLAWDDKLTTYTQERANLFKSIKNTDEHAGFNNFLEHEDGFFKLGFNQVGENSYYGGSTAF